jgi:beta-phosphoglucomutase-like phosphatase (HAD superfamily)
MPSEALHAVCFDLDGVLIDSERAWDGARRAVVAENGGTWRPDATRAMMGMSSGEWSRYLRDELGVPLSRSRAMRSPTASPPPMSISRWRPSSASIPRWRGSH